jgi:hypothetical protein
MAYVSREQRSRSLRALRTWHQYRYQFTIYPRLAVLVTNPFGLTYTVSPGHCNCPDHTRNLLGTDVRCKHREMVHLWLCTPQARKQIERWAEQNPAAARLLERVAANQRAASAAGPV